MITGVEKIGDTLEVTLADAINLVKFIKYLMVWDIVDDYLCFSGEKLVKLSEIRNYQFLIYPTSVLVPKNRYCHYLENLGWNLKIPIERKEEVVLSEPILFESYRIYKNPYGFRLGLEIEVNLEKSKMNSEKIRLSRLEIRSQHGSKSVSYHYSLFFHEDNEDVMTFEESMNKLTKSSGDGNVVPCDGKPFLRHKITTLENTLLTSVNFIYSIYNREFREDTNEYKVFTPFANLLWSYGESFEEVFSSIKEVIAFLG